VTLRLTIRTGEEPGNSVEFVGVQLTIGRDDSCDLTIKDEKVSRKHAVVALDPEGRAVLRDLESRNGTQVNGRRVQSAILTGGEQLRFGDTVVVSSVDGPNGEQVDPHQVQRAALAATRLSVPVPAAPVPAFPPASASERRSVSPREKPPPSPGEPSVPARPSPSTIQRIKLQRSLRRTTIVGIAAVISMIVVAVLLVTGAFSGNGTATAEQVVAQVAPSTVLVVADDGNGTAERGSGWVWNASRGLIVTNAHVTAGGSLYTVGTGETMTLQSDAQGQIVAGPHARAAKLIGQALCEDIAVLRASNTAGLKTLPRFSSQARLKIGDAVVAVGYPGTVSLLQNPQFGANLTGDTGVVSQPKTTFPAIPGVGGRPTTGPYHDVVLTDTPINPGNSGGPLVDYQSRLVGMNTAQRTGVQQQNYAIGVDRINKIVPELLAGQKVCS
jgi:S1-C subfamily serine protease